MKDVFKDVSAVKVLNGEETEVSGDCGEKWNAVDVKNVETQCDVVMDVEYFARDRERIWFRNMVGSNACGFSTEGTYVGSIYMQSAIGIGNGDRAMMQKVFTYESYEGSMGGTTNECVDTTGEACIMNLASGIKRFVIRNRVQKKIRSNMCLTMFSIEII